MSESLKENTPKVAKAQKLVGVKGMNDILPPDSARWEWLEGQVRALMARYAYRVCPSSSRQPCLCAAWAR